MPSINEGEFGKFISSFELTQTVYKVEWNSILEQYGPSLKKINKTILDKLLQVLDIKLE